VVVSGVQRLVKIANEMEQELEGEQPFLKIGLGVLHLGKELIDLVHSTPWAGRSTPACPPPAPPVRSRLP
jgi:hypothetical protein